MYKLTFTLKQHTPLIHFQHGQDGATLRATEVKPKLDRFIIGILQKKLERELGHTFLRTNAEQEKDFLVAFGKKYPDYLVGGEKAKHAALDYKMWIDSKENVTPKEIVQFPTFFADMGEDWQKSPKKFIFNKNYVNVIFSFLNEKLKKEIDEGFSEFIATTNFGMRQSKGFGSFNVLNNILFKNAFAKFTIEKDNQNNCIEVFRAIDLFYKTLRGGIRVYGRGGICLFYFKSFLVAYYHKSKETLKWDKAVIKQILDEGEKTARGIDIKDLLGFSTQEEWVAKYNKAKIIKSNEDIDRFSSPILFKPIYDETKKTWVVYIFLKPIPQNYREATILGKVNGANISLSMWTYFSLTDFMDFIMGYNTKEDIQQHIEDYFDIGKGGDLDNFLSHSTAHQLINIYSHLSKL